MISNLAQVSEKAQLGQNVQIDAFSVIHENVVIGDNTIIHSNVVIFPGARIGKNCEIFPGAVISAVPQDLKFEGEETTVEIGDNTKIRECVTVHRATKDKWVTKIGSNCLIMAYVHIAHDCQIGNNVILA
ncbi:MAG TPA: acyl-[acyl-carrier-protein]--UDP-N-acetylglucosamine O-acyltransferase, partial [Taishania sp.]|nr:acyl-[acyl-carrier-protein]--UDP-N-acetylglucosamine O-acyltransferase [Taishania sp.]